MSKLVLLAVGTAGYVLGARAGRERYEQIVRAVQRTRNDPRVRQKASEATDLAKQKGPVLKDQAAGLTRDVAAKVGPGDRQQTSGRGR